MAGADHSQDDDGGGLAVRITGCRLDRFSRGEAQQPTAWQTLRWQTAAVSEKNSPQITSRRAHEKAKEPEARNVLLQRGRKPETESATQKEIPNLSPHWSASFPVRQPGCRLLLEAGRNGLCGERFADTKARLGNHRPCETASRKTSPAHHQGPSGPSSSRPSSQ